ncbi:MAG: hypothetical protein A2V66_06000 [Ignavibacteria bacterium RBG_13_36_8]|nr:MAG: hypothetical protein A2V66_06000 [Ignavibacteria bacterium RBG_13_36_8]
MIYTYSPKPINIFSGGSDKSEEKRNKQARVYKNHRSRKRGYFMGMLKKFQPNRTADYSGTKQSAKRKNYSL